MSRGSPPFPPRPGEAGGGAPPPRFEPGETEPPGWMRPVLAAGASLFGMAVRARTLAYATGLVRRVRPERPVISVGNLAVGGSGKTPFVIFLATRLAERGLAVTVLSRGYGRRAGARTLVVSHGHGPEASAADAGDEPVLIADKTRASVVVCGSRARGAAVAIDELGADVLLLDDGFQHLRLARDLDIVLLDAAQPIGNGRLLPLGPLREPPRALARAGLLVLNHGVRPANEPGPLLGAGLENRPRIDVGVVPSVLRPAGGGEGVPAATLLGKSVALLAAIARPRRFADTVEGLGGRVVHRELYRDHARLSAADVEAFVRRARTAGAEVLLTTEKDAVRIPRSALEPLTVLAIEHRLLAGADVLEQVLERVTDLARGGGEASSRG